MCHQAAAGRRGDFYTRGRPRALCYDRAMPQRRRRPLRAILAFVLLAVVGWLTVEAATWPDIGALARQPPATTAFIERWRDRQSAAGQSDRVERAWVAYPAIAPGMKVAVLVAEDVNFFSHHGFDTGEIQTALRKSFDDLALPRGASTISQQLVKNLWLSPSPHPPRKT